MARQPGRFVPRLEAFDERVLPSVTVTCSPTGILTVKGGAAADVISIRDTGNSDPGSVTVFDHGTQVFASTVPITQIVVMSGRGNDTVDYWLTSGLTSKRQVTADLGAGNDSYAAHLDGQSLAANLMMQAVGGAGKDHLELDAGHVTVGAKSWLTVDLRGGTGSDAVAFNYSPDFVDPTAVVKFTSDQKIR